MKRCVENPKFEARNPKQIQMIQIQMTQTTMLGGMRFVAAPCSRRSESNLETSGVESAIHSFVSVIGILVLRACFEFRASDFEIGRKYETGMWTKPTI
jgi:hypothetical protein